MSSVPGRTPCARALPATPFACGVCGCPAGSATTPAAAGASLSNRAGHAGSGFRPSGSCACGCQRTSPDDPSAFRPTYNSRAASHRRPRPGQPHGHERRVRQLGPRTAGPQPEKPLHADRMGALVQENHAVVRANHVDGDAADDVPESQPPLSPAGPHASVTGPARGACNFPALGMHRFGPVFQGIVRGTEIPLDSNESGPGLPAVTLTPV